MQTLRGLDRTSVLIGLLAGVLAVMLLSGPGRAQEQSAPPAGDAGYQMAMAGTRACWILDSQTGEMYKCVTDSGYDPVEVEWFRCGTPRDADKRLKMR
jgi:hypothetical protein